MARPQKRRRVTAAATAILEDLLLFEVLARLPVRSLARCRGVCCSWRAGIAGAAFVRRHRELSRAAAPSVLAVPREVDLDDEQATCGEISLHRLLLPAPGAAKAAGAELVFEKAWPAGITRFVNPAHCDGVVAVATTTDTVFVCNPATREFLALPPGAHNEELDHCELLVRPVALGFDPWRGRYFVARCFYRAYGAIAFDEATGAYSHQGYDIGHEVFTLGGGGSSSWEATQDPPHAVGVHRPVCTRRAVYWHSENAPAPLLMRFGLEDRAFAVVPRPPPGHSIVDDMAGIGTEGGRLCYVHGAAAASFHVWVADDDDDDAPALEWSLLCRVDLLRPGPGLEYCLAAVIAGGEEMLLQEDVKLLRYNVASRALEQVVDMNRELRYERPDGSKYMCQSHSFIHHVMPYFESLVSVATCNY